MKARAGQIEFMMGVQKHRLCANVARRQYGKTTIAAKIALRKMILVRGHSVIFGSVKLDLGREIVRKEAHVFQSTLIDLAAEAEAAKTRLDVCDITTGNSVGGYKPDDFAELYEASRLEFRLYHSRSVYSRTKVVALTPDAVGETGDLILDEVGRARKFQEVWEAMKPIIASNPAFRCILTTTPPPDDSHYSYELLAPPLGVDFPVNPRGNWYRSDLGVWVLRLSAADAFADGVPLYDDDTGEPLSPEESRARDPDKDAWDRNYGVRFILGGTAAVGLLVLDSAQARGQGSCACINVATDLDFQRALRWLGEHVKKGELCGIGCDLATTTSATSNPTALAVSVRRGIDLAFPLVLTWKTSDPETAIDRLASVVRTIHAAGATTRRLCLDATSERLFAATVRNRLRNLLPVEAVVGSESVKKPGTEAMNMKQYLGSLLVAQLDDNRCTAPPERYLREDFRLVKKEKGQFVCEPDGQGRHGDTFDACKLGLWALMVGDVGTIRAWSSNRGARAIRSRLQRSVA